MSNGLSADDRFGVVDVVTRYATAIDRRDWDLFRTCFTDDCAVDYGALGRWDGVEAFTGFMEQIHARCGWSLHRLSNTVIETDGDEVRVRTYVDALVLGLDNASGARSAGYYDDEVVRRADGWRIAHRTYTMVHSTMDIGKVHELDER